MPSSEKESNLDRILNRYSGCLSGAAMLLLALAQSEQIVNYYNHYYNHTNPVDSGLNLPSSINCNPGIEVKVSYEDPHTLSRWISLIQNRAFHNWYEKKGTPNPGSSMIPILTSNGIGGTGSLTKIDGCYGILTAQHVVSKILDKTGQLKPNTGISFFIPRTAQTGNITYGIFSRLTPEVTDPAVFIPLSPHPIIAIDEEINLVDGSKMNYLQKAKTKPFIGEVVALPKVVSITDELVTYAQITAINKSQPGKDITYSLTGLSDQDYICDGNSGNGVLETIGNTFNPTFGVIGVLNNFGKGKTFTIGDRVCSTTFIAAALR